jgi:hypothetical protein
MQIQIPTPSPNQRGTAGRFIFQSTVQRPFDVALNWGVKLYRNFTIENGLVEGISDSV